MSKWDPQELALRHPWVALCLFALLWVVFGYGNVVVEKGAILENALLSPNDPYQRMDDHVRAQLDEGFQGHRETIPFVLQFPGGIRTRDDLLRIADFSERVRVSLGDAVYSLSVAPRYRDEGGLITSDPYIPTRVPPDLDVERWKSAVRQDPSVYGVLVGRDFEWAAVLLLLDPDRDEVSTFRQIAEFVGMPCARGDG